MTPLIGQMTFLKLDIEYIFCFKVDPVKNKNLGCDPELDLL